jgi:L-lactate dehydrogenase complex protein LldG
MDPSSKLKLMRERAEAVQTVVREVADLEEACRYVMDLTRKQGGQVVAAPGWPEAAIASIRNHFSQDELEVLSEDLRSRANDLYTGFTRADYGIAETGSLILESTSEDLRLATMLSEVHVAVLLKSKIVPDAFALEKTFTERFSQPPCYLAFITGASRTADIERVLTIGVHGPQEVHLLLLEE